MKRRILVVGLVLAALRGGAFDLNRDLARCAVRLHLRPDFRWDYFGFRLVVAPALIF